MANQIDRDVLGTKQDTLKNPIHYVRGTDLLPIVFHFRDFSIPSGATARAICREAGRERGIRMPRRSRGTDVTVDVQQSRCSSCWACRMLQVAIFERRRRHLLSFAQPVMVEQNLKAGDLPESTTDVSFLDDAIEQANQAVNTATTAASQAAQAVTECESGNRGREQSYIRSQRADRVSEHEFRFAVKQRQHLAVGHDGKDDCRRA